MSRIERAFRQQLAIERGDPAPTAGNIQFAGAWHKLTVLQAKLSRRNRRKK